MIRKKFQKREREEVKEHEKALLIPNVVKICPICGAYFFNKKAKFCCKECSWVYRRKRKKELAKKC